MLFFFFLFFCCFFVFVFLFLFFLCFCVFVFMAIVPMGLAGGGGRTIFYLLIGSQQMTRIHTIVHYCLSTTYYIRSPGIVEMKCEDGPRMPLIRPHNPYTSLSLSSWTGFKSKAVRRKRDVHRTIHQVRRGMRNVSGLEGRRVGFTRRNSPGNRHEGKVHA